MNVSRPQLQGKWKFVASVAAMFALAQVFVVHGNDGRTPIPPTTTVVPAEGIEGTWRVASVHYDGRSVNADNKIRYQFQDGRLVVHTGNEPSADLTYKTDQSVTPHHLDVIVRVGIGVQVSRMSYQMEGDTLTICYPKPGEPRPTDLVSQPNQRQTLIVLKRVSTLQFAEASSPEIVNEQPLQTEVTTPIDDPETSSNEIASTTVPDTNEAEVAASTPEPSVEAESKEMFVGQVVLANWASDRYWYPATIVKIDGNRAHVRYMDGDEEDLTKEQLMLEKLKVGDQVFANWKGNGKYYPAKVTSRNGDTLNVIYNDDDTEKTTLAMVRVRHGDDPAPTRRVNSRRSSSNTWSYTPRQRSGSSYSNQFRQYQMQQQANAYRRQSQQLRARAYSEAHENAAREMRNFRSQHRPYSY